LPLKTDATSAENFTFAVEKLLPMVSISAAKDLKVPVTVVIIKCLALKLMVLWAVSMLHLVVVVLIIFLSYNCKDNKSMFKHHLINSTKQ
jgi:hypothetical protein